MEEGETIASITNELLQANKSILAARPPEAGTAKDYASAVGPDSDLFKTLMKLIQQAKMELQAQQLKKHLMKQLLD